jgi:hypothetical protein
MAPMGTPSRRSRSFQILHSSTLASLNHHSPFHFFTGSFFLSSSHLHGVLTFAYCPRPGNQTSTKGLVGVPFSGTVSPRRLLLPHVDFHHSAQSEGKPWRFWQRIGRCYWFWEGGKERTLAGEAASSWTDQGGGCARHLWPVHVENFGMLACYVEYPVSVIFYS